jgi:transposase
MMEFAKELKNRRDQFLTLCSVLIKDYEKVKLDLIDYKTKANYWESQFKRLKTKETELTEEVARLNAELRKREQQLFGRKTEKKTRSESKSGETKKNRGQQKGSNGHGRRSYKNLPSVTEIVDINDSEKFCSCCGLEYKPIEATEDSEILEVINVKAYKRVIKRKKYKRYCNCKTSPKIITAAAMQKILPKSKIGVSIWASLLLQKYEYQQPIYRFLKQWESNGLSLAIGTITAGFKNLMPLLSPVYDGIVDHNIKANHWHADETGWKVFESIEGKHSSRWYLWIFANKESVVYKLDPSRSSKVLDDHFNEKSSGILNVDRYVAYKAIAKKGIFILAFCWAHVRRDFLTYAKGYPKMENWAFDWIKSIGKLYEINNKRIKNEIDSKEYKSHEIILKKEIEEFQNKLNKQLAEETLMLSAKKVLISLKNHWEGLTVFVDRPEIPMDNNIAERGLRHSVIGRKNYYGSSAVWSGELAAIMFTIFETIKRWKLNPHTWLISYLQNCEYLGGKPPDLINDFLPWNMTAQQKVLFAQPPVGENSS